ncbi:amino acid permease [Halorarum salinum]|uniref:Amino acid permease n=2 Tax=Halorarum salinum TaxID=2743089 RepID=A0A7D5QDV9_9EURY|nr:amino acid permease [Halobaculum salinum]
MSLFDITFIGVGAMIGAGVFALTGFAAGIAGPALVLAFALNGFVALFTAVSYAELGAAFPEAGGGYLWVKEALVDPNGFYAGWMSWFAHAVACSLYAVTFGAFLLEFIIYGTALGHDFLLWGFVTPGMADRALAVLMVGAFAYINYQGAEETGKAGIVVTAIKVILLGVFVVFGIMATLSTPTWPRKFLSNPGFMPNGVVGIIGAMGFTYIAFEGYEIIVQSGEEVVEPGTNVPRAVFYSLAIVVPIYVLVAFAAIGGIDVTSGAIELARPFPGPAPEYTWQLLGEMGELGIIRAAGQFVPYGVPLLLIAGLTATMSALNATIYSSSRVSFAMGRDRALPGFFDNVHPEKRTPHWAILLSAILIAAMAVILPIEAVAASADIMFILLFVQVNWTLIRMRQTHPDLPRTYEVPYMPWPPLIGIGLQLLLTPFLIRALGLEAIGIGTGNHGLVALGTTAIWMTIGLLIYYGYSRRKEAEKLERESPAIVAEQASGQHDYRILVPLANPESADQLIRTAIDLARENDGEIVVMSVVTVPQQTPLSEGRRFVEDEREVLDRAMEIGEEANVPIGGTIRIGHDVAQAILNTIEHGDVDAVLLGWRGRSRRQDFVFGSNVDEVITKARCDVLVERIGPRPGSVEEILLPIAGGPHAKFAAEVARAIGRATNAHVHVINVVAPDASNADRTEAREKLAAIRSTFDADANVDESVIEGRAVADTIVEMSSEYDVTLVGATREGLFQQLLFGAIPEEIGQRAENTVIMVKRSTGIRSRMKRWFKRRNR